jgi:phosphoribosylformylglycinamidine cyclo-ligase
MPGLYARGDFDLAGFCVGVVDQDDIVDGKKVAPGHAIVGVASSGIHSNGFSFVRKVFKKSFVLAHAEEILQPTRLYVKPVLSLLAREPVYAMAHITGGGFYDNIPRVLPAGCGALIHMGSWPVPRVFRWIEEQGAVQAKEMYRTFNMGVGFILVTPKPRALRVVQHLGRRGLRAWVVGEVTKGGGVNIQ